MVDNCKTAIRSHQAKALLFIAFLACLGLTSSNPVKIEFNFGTPVNLGSNVNSPAREASPNITADGLQLYFQSDRSDGSGGWDLWVAKRNSTSDPWSRPMNLGPTINSEVHETTPNISADNLTLYFSSNRIGSYGEFDIWMATRAKVSDPWGTPMNLGRTVNSAFKDGSTSISSDGLKLYFGSKRTDGFGDSDLWVTARTTTKDAWDKPVNMGRNVNITASDGGPSISADGLSLLFESSRLGGYPGDDLWITTRETVDDPWEKSINLGSTVNSQFIEATPCISSDGRELFFQSNRPGGSGNSDIWVSTRK